MNKYNYLYINQINDWVIYYSQHHLLRCIYHYYLLLFYLVFTTLYLTFRIVS